MRFAERAEALSGWICGCRHHLHAEPELSYKESDTTRYIADRLFELGLPVQTFDDYQGCIATIRGSRPGKTVMLRADIDALPVTEQTGLPFTSRRPGVMHACGHDCHTAMLLGAARLLCEAADRLPGTVKLLFQSGEEAFVGSRRYVELGCLKGVDALMGMHVWPSIPAGTVSIQQGPILASCDNFRLKIIGKEAPGAHPEQGADAIAAAAAVLQNLQSIVSRGTAVSDGAVITVGSVRAGTDPDRLCGFAVLEGSVRTASEAVRTHTEQQIRRTCRAVCEAYACTTEVDYEYLVPPVVNSDAGFVHLAREAAADEWGTDVLSVAPQAMASEDFSILAQAVPSSLFIITGMRDEAAGYTAALHSPTFDIPEERVLKLGAALHARIAWEYLTRKEAAPL